MLFRSIVDIQANGDNQNVSFLRGGSGGLELNDTASNPAAFGGTVAGFGQNTAQFIDLTAVASGGGVSLSYTSKTSSSGVLTVSSGGTVVASINFSGSYTTSSFHLTSGAGGTVEIFDPPVEPQKNAGSATDSKTPPVSPDPLIAGSSRSNDDLAGMHWPDAPDTVAGASFISVGSENLLFSSPGSIDQPMNRTNDMAKFTELLAGWDQGRSQPASSLFSTTLDSSNSFAQDDRTSHQFVAAGGHS